MHAASTQLEKICCLNCQTINNYDLVNNPNCHSCSDPLVILNNRYHPLRSLGRGGFAITYFAADTDNLNTHCVIKQLRPQSHSQQAEQLFHQEARALQTLSQEKDQIPSILAFFKETKYWYLVQEYILGKTLDEMFDDRAWTEQEITDFLKNILPVISFIHENNIIHRDIKPNNIICQTNRGSSRYVLIDFGASTLIKSSTQPGTIIGTQGYAPPEQMTQGISDPSSDLFSLGVTCFYLLTRVNIHNLALNEGYQWLDNWQQHLQQPRTISRNLRIVLTKLLQRNRSDRYQSALEVLNALNSTFTPPTPILKPVVGAIITSILGIGLYSFFQPTPPLNITVSTGEKELITNTTRTSDKKDGITAFKGGDYEKAKSLFEKSLQNTKNDPETRIYLNNANIKIEKSPSYSIAVIIPNNDQNKSAEILRGVALAQDQINKQKINGKYLKIMLVDDHNETKTAEEVANYLTENKEVLGVVGHWSSDVTLKVGEIYKEKGLVAISPGSTTTELSNFKGNYIWRSVPDDKVTAKKLVDYSCPTKSEIKKCKTVIFYNSKGSYSSSLKNEFFTMIKNNGGKVVHEVDLNTNSDTKNALNEAQNKGADVIMLAPDSNTVDKALEVVRENSKLSKPLPILAGDAFYGPKILPENNVQGTVIAIPWHISGHISSQFAIALNSLWGSSNVSWRTVTSYNATQTFITALKTNTNPTRETVQKALKKPDFTVEGATSQIKFSSDGNCDQPVELVRVIPNQSSTATNDFESIKF
jgi:ABC-type branched-subunit amino acid transport system substrate-binding protein/tRNA A-37 threonylcarbamoyl transferase component Bud32